MAERQYMDGGEPGGTCACGRTPDPGVMPGGGCWCSVEDLPTASPSTARRSWSSSACCNAERSFDLASRLAERLTRLGFVVSAEISARVSATQIGYSFGGVVGEPVCVHSKSILGCPGCLAHLKRQVGRYYLLQSALEGEIEREIERLKGLAEKNKSRACWEQAERLQSLLDESRGGAVGG